MGGLIVWVGGVSYGSGARHYFEAWQMEDSGDARLGLLMAGADATSLTIDFLHDLTEGLSLQALRIVIDNASSMPSYRKSKDSPYVFRSARAPSIDSRVPPDSQLET